MKYIASVQSAYDEYVNQKPLDLRKDTGEQLDVWREVIRYSLPEYVRKVSALAQSSTLDEFVICSGGDFDNLAPVIRTAIGGSLLSISPEGKIIPEQEPYTTEIAYTNNKILVPHAEYNQFPCDNESADFRAQFILDRYPYREDIHIGLIGDDDFISLRLVKDPSVRVSIVEKDVRIVKMIKEQEYFRHAVNVYDFDVRDVAPDVGLDTFVTDPPYTFDGSLAFIACGLSMMGSAKGKEFYVVLNPTMMGRRWGRLVKILALHGIVLTNAQENVSNYKLPNNFDERNRADVFLELINVRRKALNYSSSSTMYTFLCTDEVDVDALRAVVKGENIYEHYS